MKNKLSDLNNHLFTQLERLCDEDLSPKQLELELERTKAIKGIAQEVISAGKLSLDAHLAVADGQLGNGVKNVPELLQIENKHGQG